MNNALARARLEYRLASVSVIESFWRTILKRALARLAKRKIKSEVREVVEQITGVKKAE